MKATLLESTYPYARKPLLRMPKKHFSAGYVAVVFRAGLVYEAVTIRVYETDTRTYAHVYISDNCSWVDTKTERELFYGIGTGSAGGGGYHKASAAVEEAFCNAGVKFDTYLHSDYDIMLAAQAVARALWADADYVHVSEIGS